MTTFSLLTTTTVLATSLLAPSADAVVVSMDVLANGRYWWGGRWSHRPRYGDTGSCVCITGTQPDGTVVVGCRKDYRVPSYTDSSPFSIGALDWSKPIDISILGDDALLVDRFQLNRPNEQGGGRRFYGVDNTAGYCLSTDPNDDGFDRHVSVPEGRCYSAFSLTPNGKVANRYYTASYLQERAEASCDFVRSSSSGRRMEAPGWETGAIMEQGMLVSTVFDQEDAHAVSSTADESNDGSTDDGEGEGDDGVVFADPADIGAAMALDELHEAIRKLIHEGADVPEAELDALLSAVVLRAEHHQEVAEHDGEVEVIATPEDEEDVAAPQGN